MSLSCEYRIGEYGYGIQIHRANLTKSSRIPTVVLTCLRWELINIHNDMYSALMTCIQRFYRRHFIILSSSFYLNQATRPININKRHVDRHIDSIS